MATQPKQLRQNPYVTDRDRITGQWVVIKPQQQAA
jgi:hypothetical protein